MKRSPHYAATIAALSLLCLSQGLLRADEKPSMQPPSVYTEKIAPLLTPLDTVLKDLPNPPESAEDGWILLDETVHYLLPDGRRIYVQHQICKALTQAGVEELGRTVHNYRIGVHKMHLALARTILPNGQKIDVKPEAVFIQTPQREADAALYRDENEMVVIYPNVKPNVITESIEVLEDNQPRIPGQFTGVLGMRTGWPVLHLRTWVETPEDWASRLHITPIGAGIPEPQVTALDDHRKRWTWERNNVPPEKPERGAPPFLQGGTLVRLTTLPDWNTFLHWYVPLANRAIQLGAPLEKEVDEWTKDAHSPLEIIQILTQKVSDDVRYTGLEFSHGDLEPHPVSEVWQQQYGDCKDKASLLTAMLVHTGLKAHMTLINTEHLGRVDRRCPDYRDFNHAIVCVDMPEGPLFCDPTQTRVPAGTISPSDADRDVLLVTEPERWLHTPPQDAGTYSIDIKGKIAANGEISGWANFKAEGYLAYLYADADATDTRQELRRRLTSEVAKCYPGARVVDVKTIPHDKRDPHYEAQAYFVAPPSGSLTVSFPFDHSSLPNLEEHEDRRSDVFFWVETKSGESEFEMPVGYHVTAPAPYHFSTPLAEGSAQWETDGRTLKAKFHFRNKFARIPAAEARGYAHAIAAFRAWLSKSVTLEPGEGAPTVATPAAPTLSDFPQMPTGEGQLNLVDERFPIDGNRVMRRNALEKTLTMFPHDGATQFRALVQLAYLDFGEGAYDKAVQRILGPAAAFRGSADVEEGGVADYILAITYKAKGDTTQAMTLLDQLCQNKQISAFRRGWAQFQRAVILTPTDFAKAEEAFHASIKEDVSHAADIYPRLAKLMLEHEQGPDLENQLRDTLKEKDTQPGPILAALARLANSYAFENPKNAELLIGILEHIGDASSFGEDFAKNLAQARLNLTSGATFAEIRAKLQAWGKEHSGDLPEWSVPDSLDTPERFTEAIADQLKQKPSNAKALVRLAVESLSRFTPGPWYGERLWRAVSFTDYLDRVDKRSDCSPLLLELIQLSLTTPPGSETNIETRFIQAAALERRHPDEAAPVLKSLLDQTPLDSAYLSAAIGRYAALSIERKDYEEALRAWRKLDKCLVFFDTPVELEKAALLCLELGRSEDALKQITALENLDASVIAKCPQPDRVKQFLQTVKNREAIQAWWNASPKWWPAWRAVAHSMDNEVAEHEVVLPYIPNLLTLGQEFGSLSIGGQRAEAWKRLNLLAHASRWDPALAGELAGMVTAFPKIGLNSALPDFHKLMIALSEQSEAADPQSAAALKMWGAVALVDSGDNQRALLASQAPKGEEVPTSINGVVMARIHGIAAARTGLDMEPTSKRLEKILAIAGLDNDRMRTVSVLAWLYEKLHRANDEKALLETELKNPDIAKLGSEVDVLRRRLEALNDSAGADGDGPALAAEAWLKAATPPWLSFSRPKNLTDTSVGDLDKAIAPTTNLSPPESAKVCLLVAQDPNQPDERRRAAIVSLGRLSTFVAQDAETARRWIKAIVDTKAVPRRIRALALATYIDASFLQDSLTAQDGLLKDPVLEDLPAEGLASIQVLTRYHDLALTDMEGCYQMAKDLLDHPETSMSLTVTAMLIRRLAEGGQLDRAHELYLAFGKAQVDEANTRERSSEQLALLKIINHVRKQDPVNQALRDYVLAHFQAPLPEKLPTIFHPSLTLDLTPEVATAVRIDQLRHNAWSKEDSRFWIDLAGDLPLPSSQRTEINLEMLRIALEKSTDDVDRSRWVLTSGGLVDIDDEPTRVRLAEIVKPYREKTDTPETSDAIRSLDLQVKLRSGAAADPFTALALIHSPLPQASSRRSILRWCLANQDRTNAKRFIDQANTSELLADGNLKESFQAYRLLGMNDELELAQDHLRDLAYQAVLAAWSTGDVSNAHHAIEIAITMKDPSLIPEAFIKDFISHAENPRNRLFLQCHNALLRSQWEELERLSAEGCQTYNTYYDFFRLRAQALAHLDRKKEAQEAAAVYLNKVHDEPEVAELRAMVKAE